MRFSVDTEILAAALLRPEYLSQRDVSNVEWRFFSPGRACWIRINRP